jgi:GNAT superfamily N-acetyltransferase
LLERKEILNESDIQWLHPVIVDIWTEVFTPIIGKDQVDYMLQNYQGIDNIRQEIQQGILYFALMFQNECIGYTAYELKTDYIYLSKIYIEKAYRGKGFMREIFDWYDQLSHQYQRKQLLRVNQGNERAIKVYNKREFKLIAEDIVDIGAGFQMVDYLFEKNS